MAFNWISPAPFLAGSCESNLIRAPVFNVRGKTQSSNRRKKSENTVDRTFAGPEEEKLAASRTAAPSSTGQEGPSRSSLRSPGKVVESISAMKRVRMCLEVDLRLLELKNG